MAMVSNTVPLVAIVFILGFVLITLGIAAVVALAWIACARKQGCPHCGKTIPLQANFCQHCGANTRQPADAATPSR